LLLQKLQDLRQKFKELYEALEAEEDEIWAECPQNAHMKMERFLGNVFMHRLTLQGAVGLGSRFRQAA
jgi:hypothetical protein